MAVLKIHFGIIITTGSYFYGTPIFYHPRNLLDGHGEMFDLDRLPGEEGVFYKRRLEEAATLRANSTVRGLTYGITRELGLEIKIGLIISPTSTSSEYVASSPFSQVSSTKLSLWENYAADLIDSEIGIFDHNGSYLLSDLVTEINRSKFFVAKLGPYVTGNERSSGLIPSMSRGSKIYKVPAVNRFLFEHTNIIPGSVFFSEKDIFSKEFSPEIVGGIEPPSLITFTVFINGGLAEEGDFRINYRKGEVNVYQKPSGMGICRYNFLSFPWYILWSPIEIYSLRDTEYQEKVFESENMPDLTTQNGTLTLEGTQVFREIFRKSPCMWGA